MTYTDEEIIKALECCISGGDSCLGCPRNNRNDCGALDDDVLKLLKRQRAELEKRQWISVEDRLPEEHTWVLVYRRNFFSDVMDLYVYLGDNEWQDCDGRIFKMYEKGITHWIPLPEPPKGD